MLRQSLPQNLNLITKYMKRKINIEESSKRSARQLQVTVHYIGHYTVLRLTYHTYSLVLSIFSNVVSVFLKS